MLHAREDYNRRIQDRAKKIPAKEPVFLLRGQDEIAFRAVQAWAHLHQQNGGSDVAYLLAMAHADKMEAWAKKFGKKADVPPEALPVGHKYRVEAKPAKKRKGKK